MLTLILVSSASAAPLEPQQRQMFAVESALSGAGYTIDSADGVVDTSTREALRSFQAEHDGLKSTGKIDDETLLALGVTRENGRDDEPDVSKAVEKTKPSAEPTHHAASAGEAESGKAAPRDEDEEWLFSW